MAWRPPACRRSPLVGCRTSTGRSALRDRSAPYPHATRRPLLASPDRGFSSEVTRLEHRGVAPLRTSLRFGFWLRQRTRLRRSSGQLTQNKTPRLRLPPREPVHRSGEDTKQLGARRQGGTEHHPVPVRSGHRRAVARLGQGCRPSTGRSALHNASEPLPADTRELALLPLTVVSAPRSPADCPEGAAPRAAKTWSAERQTQFAPRKW
jgi:hypothetical protein